MAGLPLNPDGAVIFVLYSIHDVMKAEFSLRDEGVPYDMIPVPKEVSSDCGMAILVGPETQERVQAVLRENKLKIKGKYLKKATGYEVLNHG